MDLMIQIGKWIAHMMDPVLGWMLLMPRDFAVLIVALGTSVILTLSRRFTTDQDLMHRCKDDLARLKQLRKRAKAAKDKLTLGRIATSVGMINLKQMKAEGWGLLASLLPIVLLASWAFERLDYIPPKAGEQLLVRATYPAAAADQLAWLTAEPADGVRIKSLTAGPDGALAPQGRPTQAIRLDDNIDPLTGHKIETAAKNGLATWLVTVDKPSVKIDLRFSYAGKAVVHPLRVGDRSYEAPMLVQSDDPNGWPECSTQVVLKQAWFLDRLPGVTSFWKWWVNTSSTPSPPAVVGFWPSVKSYCWDTPLYFLSMLTWFAPWLAAYLVITIPLVPLLRRMMRVY